MTDINFKYVDHSQKKQLQIFIKDNVLVIRSGDSYENPYFNNIEIKYLPEDGLIGLYNVLYSDNIYWSYSGFRVDFSDRGKEIVTISFDDGKGSIQSITKYTLDNANYTLFVETLKAISEYFYSIKFETLEQTINFEKKTTVVQYVRFSKHLFQIRFLDESKNEEYSLYMSRDVAVEMFCKFRNLTDH